MKKLKTRTFQDRLREELRNPDFKKHFEEEKQALNLALTIIELREKLELTQKELAEKMETSQQMISRLESGEYEGFTLKTLKKLAQATGTVLKIELLPAQ